MAVCHAFILLIFLPYSLTKRCKDLEKIPEHVVRQARKTESIAAIGDGFRFS